ncbi:hypothetical protein PN290_02565 [Romboutsia sp. 1001216sp1]|uniref:hypothetical protein n=1 Tax=unclassified Romboutsia TaxID=2626894 RepID=UPI0018A897A6|nr:MULTISPECIES: hypothetical protein [unclassified Romboutsia]MDB8792576.1 hypothetical protein [Romboutsia sp. 1001216sp1]MDB8796256.1 hypothetical protein [Romboutsia sp. 1001216sp1]MDB8798250.1 hypothetical protein [Romboutsia sp. 1001216sp1]
MDNVINFKLVIPFMILIIMFLGNYISEKKFKPNKALLEEIENLEFSRRFFILGIILVILITSPLNKNTYFSLLIIIVALIAEWIRIKYALKFLSDKDESESTKKYISTMAIFQCVYAIALAFYFIFF